MRASASSTSRAGSSGFCGARWKTVTPNGRTSPGFQPVRTFCDVGRVARPDQDLARPQEERVLLVAVDRDPSRVPLRGQFAHAGNPLRCRSGGQGRGAGGWRDVLELADDAVRLASADARAARRLAEEALAAADDAETRSTAERALGLAAVELGDAAAAVEHFRRAIAIAEAAGLTRRAAEARMSLALALTLTGASAEALAEADRAEPDLEGPARARLQGQRAVILQKLGRLDEALAGLPAAARRVPARRRRAVGGAAAVQPRRAAGLPRRARVRRERLPARGDAARVDRPGAGRDPGPPQPRLGRRAARRRPGRAGLVRPRRGRVPRSTACRWRCC